MAISNHTQFFSLLKELPGANKETIVFAYSNGATESLSKFYEQDRGEYNFMLQDLKKRVDVHKAEAKFAKERRTKMLRSAILTRIQKHGVDTSNWENVNSFLEQPRICGKRLYEMSCDEMQDLIPKLESILKKDKDREKEITRQSQLN